MWPTILARKDEEVLAYEAKLKETQKANYLYYNNYVYQKEKGMFSSYDAEERVGYAFLKYGIKICNQLNKSTFRPLGLTTPPSFGFGSLVATDYNISNTAPLVMWWGSLEVNDAGPLDVGILFFQDGITKNYIVMWLRRNQRYQFITVH